MRILDDQTRAIITSGLLRPIDLAFAVGFGLECMTMVYWRIFGLPSAEQMIVLLVATVAYFQLWVVVLLFRVGVMILKVRADVNLMPEAAARIAAQIRVGSAPTDRKV